MSLLNVIKLNLTLSQKELFNDLSFQVESGDRIGLLGPNGSGKTTLLRIISNEVTPDRGEVNLKSGSLMGYLPQDVSERLSGQLLPSVIDSIPGRASKRLEIGKIEKALGNNPEKEEQILLAEKLTEIYNEINVLDNIYPSHRAEKILSGLGFQASSFNEPVSSLSGGWRMRAALASILYQDPDLLLLDEPTNYLDLPSVRWLEQFLSEFDGAIILVCHDREFLNRQINCVISFEQEGIKNYKGNYDRYLEAREEEVDRLEAMARNQEQKVKEAKKFIDRFRYKATKARQAQSKIKLLKKMEIVKTHKSQKRIKFSFPDVSRSGRNVLTIKAASKSYGDKTLYRDIDLDVLRGDRVGLIGPNGYGKTTLLRMIAGEEKQDAGTITLGHNVELSYYAQHHSEMLDPRKTILEEVYQVVPHENVSLVRNICGAFLFSGDDVDKPVRVLSGGEKARVSLAKILIKPGNLLVMDEPTNHLDLISSEILIDALVKYEGTLLFVSHNQSFINRLANRIWDIKDRQITEYPGTLNEYYHYLEKNEKIENLKVPAVTDKQLDNPENGLLKPVESKKELRRKKAEKRKEIGKILKPVEEKLSMLEEEIFRLETREKEISNLLTDPELFKDSSRSVPLLSEYKKLKQDLDNSIIDWEETHNQMEELKEGLVVDSESS